LEVTVKDAVAELPASSVAVIVYVPIGTDGTVKLAVILPNMLCTYALATSVSPNLMLARVLEVNPAPMAPTDVPAGP
jgi:hypothetical protein